MLVDSQAILLFSLLSIHVAAPSGSREATRAYYKQSGLEATVTEFERERIPQELKVIVGNCALITRALVEQRVQFTWRFP